jgi:hypothetical protein
LGGDNAAVAVGNDDCRLVPGLKQLTDSRDVLRQPRPGGARRSRPFATAGQRRGCALHAGVSKHVTRRVPLPKAVSDARPMHEHHLHRFRLTVDIG